MLLGGADMYHFPPTPVYFVHELAEVYGFCRIRGELYSNMSNSDSVLYEDWEKPVRSRIGNEKLRGWKDSGTYEGGF